jgi:hypothetical protein
LRKFKAFIVEQDHKRSRAESKERDDAKIIESKLQEIAKYEIKLAALKAKLTEKTRQYGMIYSLSLHLSLDGWMDGCVITTDHRMVLDRSMQGKQDLP